MAYWKEEFMLKQRFGFGFIYLAQITQCPEIVWARKKMPPPQTGRHPIDLSSVWVTNGINEIVWDKLCFKAAVHGGQKAVKMFTGFDTSSCQGRSGHTGTPHGVDWRCPGHWASLGRDYSALSHHSGSRAWGVCWQPSPPCTLLLARKLMSKYFRFQAVPSPLPTPATRTRTLPGTNWSLRGSSWAGSRGKLSPPRKTKWKRIGAQLGAILPVGLDTSTEQQVLPNSWVLSSGGRWVFLQSTSPLGSRSPAACIWWVRYVLKGTIPSCGIKAPLLGYISVEVFPPYANLKTNISLRKFYLKSCMSDSGLFAPVVLQEGQVSHRHARSDNSK